MKKRGLKKHLERLFQKYPGTDFCNVHYDSDGTIDSDCSLPEDIECENCIFVYRHYKPTWKPDTRKELLMYITCFENEIKERRKHEKAL